MCNMHTPAEPNCFHLGYKDKKTSKDPAVLIGTRRVQTHLYCVTTMTSFLLSVAKSVVLACTYGEGLWRGHGPRRYSSVVDRQGQSVILAMYTFRVGPWLPNTLVSFPQV